MCHVIATGRMGTCECPGFRFHEDSAKEPMETFKPRVLTEPVVRRFFVKHNKGKLENPSFLPNLMKLWDGEIRGKCQARNHAAPKPMLTPTAANAAAPRPSTRHTTTHRYVTHTRIRQTTTQ